MWARIYPHAVLLILANIILKASCKGSGSLTFVIDDTYSMHDDIAQVRSSVDWISNVVFNDKSSQIENMVLVTFNDPGAKLWGVTKDRNTFKSNLNAIEVHAGGDCWEPSMKGLLLGLEKSNSDSYIFVFTDAPAKDYSKGHIVEEMCQKKQSRIFFVITGHCHYYNDEAFNVYYKIAQACSGLVIDVPKNQVKNVLPIIGETIKGNQTVITTALLPAGVKKVISFTIDDQTDYAIVSVSGTKVELHIRGPRHNTEIVMWTDNGKVVKLSNVTPGKYEATVKSDSKTSVVIVGRTDFFFSHGFSVLKPNSLGDTSLQPLAESKVHLSISVTDEYRSVQIESAQILDMSEKPINNPMPVTEISKNFYVTDLFVTPSQRFKVAVNGKIKATGKSIRRIGKIPITPKDYAPVIVTNSTTVEGIEGDLALRIPCKAGGVPKPVITWKHKGATITANAKYTLEDGALVIMKPTEKDTSSYTCEAKNHVSSDSVTFQVKVYKYPKSSGTLHYVYLKDNESKKLECEAYNSKSQSVKWFITRNTTHLITTTSRPDFESTTTWNKDASTTTRIITQDAGNKEYIQIANASSFDHDGNYTCHVSDKHGNTQTHTYVVDVGVAPVFISNTESITHWKGDVNEISQICDVYHTKPKPDVQWKYNDKVITDLSLVGVGHYTCNISNVHGSVFKQFDVETSECLIRRNLNDAPNMPLLLNEEGSWHKLESTKHYMRVEHKMKMTLSCPSQKDTPNSFKTFPKNSTLEAICYKEDSFIVNDKTYKLSDLQCTNSIEPSVIKKKTKCSTETSELISVGYNVPAFLEAYEVCFDHKSNMPSYTRIVMTETNDNGVNGGYNWYTYPGIGTDKTERGFTCKDASSSCCYSKSQLVNAIDFNDGPAKKSTFIDPLNVVPVWIPCDTSKSSWKDINDMVRLQLPIYTDVVVWSGTHTLQEKNGAVIPRYLWKVVRLAYDEVMAIVHVNDPNPTKSDVKCNTPDHCDKYEDWFKSDDSTYCCSLPDFLKSFDIHESLEAEYNKINSEHYSGPREY
ncbi:hypothetical protein PYW08_006428 [Mythimna loreyi]|uniref:Uncharacterized protein n=1 Tax=Mythimna loreyi TaxID=667449 RepID=A0ACC2QST3_9NEOP|nr:hypothetical protein PYW08_006428 [Mythimna loreyi]